MIGRAFECCSVQSNIVVTLTEGAILGGGSNGLVRLVTDKNTGRQYALKRMRKVLFTVKYKRAII